MIRSAATILVLLCAAPLLAGCYTYRAAPTAPPPGARVRVGLGDRNPVQGGGARNVGRPARELNGTLVALDDETLVLAVRGNGSVRRSARAGAPAVPSAGDTLRLARSRITGIEQRRLSSTRSALLAGGILAAVALVVEMSGQDDGSSAYPRGGEDPAKSLLLRVVPR